MLLEKMCSVATLMVIFPDNIRFGEAEEVRKGVFSTNTSILTPNYLTI